MKKARLIYDLCTPTEERRSTTLEDLENDINVETYTDEEELKAKLLELMDYDLDELEDYVGKSNLTLEDYIEAAEDILEDPGDGSPNILYLQIDEDEAKIDNLSDFETKVDGNTCTVEEIIQAYVDEGWVDEDDDYDDEDDYDEEEEEDEED